MIRNLKTMGILFLLIAGQLAYGQIVRGVAFGKNEEPAVKIVFENYKTACLHDKGEEAVKFVDSRTIKYYADMLDLAKTADSAKVETLPILDKLMVFSIRHRVSKKDILSFDGKSFFAYAIKSGMIDKNSTANISIGEVIINDAFAKGQIIVNGQKAPLYFHFYKENKRWKIDLTSLFPMSSMAFKQLVAESEMSENEFLFLALEMATGKKPGNEIWKPII